MAGRARNAGDAGAGDVGAPTATVCVDDGIGDGEGNEDGAAADDCCGMTRAAAAAAAAGGGGGGMDTGSDGMNGELAGSGGAMLDAATGASG